MANVTFRAVIEVLGKPKEHVESMLNSIVKRLNEDKRFTVNQAETHDCVPQENTKLFATFAEVELTTENVENMTGFCFDFMPSSIEINSPTNLELSAADFSRYLNDLQAKLHQVDMIAKQMKMERDMISKNTADLLKNYILILLTSNKLTLEQLSGFTGVEADKLADYLDKLIDMRKVDLEGDQYFRVKNN